MTHPKTAAEWATILHRHTLSNGMISFHDSEVVFKDALREARIEGARLGIEAAALEVGKDCNFYLIKMIAALQTRIRALDPATVQEK